MEEPLLCNILRFGTAVPTLLSLSERERRLIKFYSLCNSTMTHTTSDDIQPKRKCVHCNARSEGQEETYNVGEAHREVRMRGEKVRKNFFLKLASRLGCIFILLFFTQFHSNSHIHSKYFDSKA